jgi:NAD(P)-dependent dehydrogenase (short-subunit alcohol dehydrogenase family)
MGALDGKVAAITGASSGIGEATALALVAEGASVALAARRKDRIDDLATRIEDDGGKALAIETDVAEEEQARAFVERANDELGGLDVLVNNASDLGPTPLALLGDTECEDLERALATNLVGPFRLTKAVLGALARSARERRGAVVLNVSSDAAINAYPTWGAYGASKAALHHLTRIWDEELASQGVRFLSIDPGDMDTPLHAIAVPDADPALLKRPEVAAAELVEAMVRALPAVGVAR